jgi:hypothetical protein
MMVRIPRQPNLAFFFFVRTVKLSVKLKGGFQDQDKAKGNKGEKPGAS